MGDGGAWPERRTNTTLIFSSYYPRGDKMDKANQEQQNQRKSEDLFTSVTNKAEPENQNQTHNSRREGMGPNTKRKPS